MDPTEIVHTLGSLSSKIDGVNRRLDDHIGTEERWRREILQAVNDIQATLHEATGAKKLFVWVLGVVIAAIALAKGWVIGNK